jgi:hypothetical protein
MPSPLTLGHILLAAALLEALTGAIFLMSAARLGSAGRGTPSYARGRDRRRAGILLMVSAIVFAALALLTPLAETAIA